MDNLDGIKKIAQINARARRERLLALYEMGYTVEALGRLEGVSKERISQILNLKEYKEKQNEVSN